jgi:glycosyltransferase involved in cell wall biosynthesis
MESQMRLLLVTHYYPEERGGIEMVAGELASRLAAQGIRIVWAASGVSGHTPEPVPGIERLPMDGWDGVRRRFGVPLPLWTHQSMRRLCDAVADADVIHMHDTLYLGNIVASWACRRHRRPFVVTQHTSAPHFPNPLLKLAAVSGTALVSRRILAQCDQAVFISRIVMDRFRKVHFRSQPQFIPNGVDHDRFFPVDLAGRDQIRGERNLPLDRPVVFFAGRFIGNKGLPLIRELATEFRDCVWLFAGHGPIDPRSWNLPNVVCLGLVEPKQIGPYYRAADLLILPSRSEGFPLVVQEALACGIPALVTRGITDGIPGVNDIVFEASHDFEAFRLALRGALSDRFNMCRRGEAGASFATRHFDWNECAVQYAGIFDRLSSRRRMPATLMIGERPPLRSSAISAS